MACTTANTTTTAVTEPAPTLVEPQLKLFGTWASSYTHRVQLALKLKGLEFDHVEEDLANKSPSLLLHNPIYKKVPVLLHSGRSIVESVIILEYVDESWPETHPILPKDPFERSLVRFWCHFVDDKLGPVIGTVFRSTGEEQRAAVDEVHSNLGLIEAELRDGWFKGRRFFGGEKIGLLDIVLGCGSYWLSVFESVADVKLVDQDTFPLFSTWLKEFEELEEVKDIIPPADKLMDYARGLRQMLLSLANMNTIVPAVATSGADTADGSKVEEDGDVKKEDGDDDDGK